MRDFIFFDKTFLTSKMKELVDEIIMAIKNNLMSKIKLECLLMNELIIEENYWTQSRILMAFLIFIVNLVSNFL